jgi:hypothetical protein
MIVRRRHGTDVTADVICRAPAVIADRNRGNGAVINRDDIIGMNSWQETSLAGLPGQM